MFLRKVFSHFFIAKCRAMKNNSSKTAWWMEWRWWDLIKCKRKGKECETAFRWIFEVWDVVSGPTSHDNEQIPIVNAGQENSTPPLNNENNSGNENVQVPNLVSGPSTSSNACGFKMEKPKLPKFAGDVREYAIFKADFNHAIEARYTKRDSITFFTHLSPRKATRFN